MGQSAGAFRDASVVSVRLRGLVLDLGVRVRVGD